MQRNKGFTLIELLIVVVIIGILAAIAIPKFASTKDKAYVAAMKSDLRNLATYEEQYAAERNNHGHSDRRSADELDRDRRSLAEREDLRQWGHDAGANHLRLTYNNEVKDYRPGAIRCKADSPRPAVVSCS